MSNFTFRLRTLLQVREDRRDRLREHLAEAIEDNEILVRCQADLERQHRELQARYREAAGPGELDVEELIECGRYDRLIGARQDELEEQRQQAAREIDRRRGALLAADRDVRVLEKLEKKQEGRHREQQKRRETMVLDEMATMAHNR